MKSIRPLKNGFRLSENLNHRWLWLTGIGGALLVVLAILLDIRWKVENILPSVALSFGTGAILFAVLFLLERRIVQHTSMFWVTALEELAAQTGQSPNKIADHFGGPVTVVNEFIDAILSENDYKHAWLLADPIWRLCRAQAWLWSNRNHPAISKFEKNATAQALAETDSVHELWESFAETELTQFRKVWLNPDLRTFGAASATRKVEDGEIILLVDLVRNPDGFMVQKETQINGISFLVRKIDGDWHIANLVGDHIPEPSWPPDWKEGWTYWDQVALRTKQKKDKYS